MALPGTLERTIDALIEREGGFVDDPADPGGARAAVDGRLLKVGRDVSVGSHILRAHANHTTPNAGMELHGWRNYVIMGYSD